MSGIQDLILSKISLLQNVYDNYFNDMGNTVPELYETLLELFPMLEDELSELENSLTNESSTRSQSDLNLFNLLNELDKRLTNLVYPPLGNTDDLAGSRRYPAEFNEMFSTDDIDGLNQKFSFFTNVLAEKISDIIVSNGTGLTIDKSNPAFPVITQNRPLWANIQNKPSIPTNPELQANKGQANGYANLDSTGKVPVSQIPFLDSALLIVNNITERNALIPTGNLTVFVRDATLDPSVSVGWATYLYDFSNSSWVKKSEGESLDLTIVSSWLDLLDKPSTFPPSMHSQEISTIDGLEEILLLKRNLTDIMQIYEIEDAYGNTLDLLLDAKFDASSSIPALQITEGGGRIFLTPTERTRWNNELIDFGLLLVDLPTPIELSSYNSFKITLGGNITLSFNSPRAGQVYVVKFLQDATGNRTVTLPGSCIVATGESVDLGANKKSILTLHYDGTEFLCSWKKGW